MTAWSNVYPRPMPSNWALKRKRHIAASSSFLGNLGACRFLPPRKKLLYSHLVLRWVQHAHQLASQRIHHRRLLDRHCPPHQHRLYHFLEGPCPLPQLQPLTLLFQPVRLQAHGVAPPRTPFYSAIPGEICKPSNPKLKIRYRVSGARASGHTLTLFVLVFDG